MFPSDALHVAPLRAFAAVVEHGSFTRAAEQLYLTQPAVSAHVRRLELYVGSPLLVRDGRKVVPTVLGLTVYRYACEMRSVLGNLQHDIEAVRERHLNHCAIGGPRIYCAYVLTDLLARFQQMHPSTHLTLVEVASTVMVERIRQGELDLGVALELNPPDDDGAIQLGTEPRIIVESTRRPITRDGRLTYDEYVQAPYVRLLLGGGQAGSWMENSPREWQFDRQNAVMSVSGWESAKRLVRAGRGLLGTFYPVVRAELDAGEFRTVSVEGLEVDYYAYLLTARQQRTPAVVKELVEMLRADFPRAIAPGPARASG